MAKGAVRLPDDLLLLRREGTIFLVTHDQDLLEEVGTRVWHFEGGRINDFKGTYEEYAPSLVQHRVASAFRLRAQRFGGPP